MDLPFSIQQFLEIFAAYNNAIWPMQILLDLVALLAVALCLRTTVPSRVISAILAFLWAWTGIVYHIIFFSSINPAAYVFGALFIIQAVLFLVEGTVRDGIAFGFRQNAQSITGAVMLLYALLLYPILGHLLGHPYPTAPTFGAPCPTTIFTFGLLLMTTRRIKWFLVVIPLLWSLIATTAAFKLGILEDIGLLVAGVVGSTILLTRRHAGASVVTTLLPMLSLVLVLPFPQHARAGETFEGESKADGAKYANRAPVSGEEAHGQQAKGQAQPAGRHISLWNGRQCAVCLTYDDGLNTHLNNVVPLLDSLGLKATFYIAPSFPGFRSRPQDWKAAAARGHELGNHSLFHPCEGGRPGREWVSPDHDLNSYTARRMTEEIDMAELLLRTLDGKSRRTFAYPCGEMKASGVSYVDSLRTRFPGARSTQGRLEQKPTVDPYNIGSFVINGESGEKLISMVRKAMEEQALVVFLFHGVGGEHALNVSLEAHSALLRFLKANERSIWVAPLVEIAEEITHEVTGKSLRR